MNAMTELAPNGPIRSRALDGHGGALASKWSILKAAEDAREPLGLKRTSLALLRTMISLIRSERISGQAEDTHICYASNATLADRVHVSITTVERHVAALVEAGLLRRVVGGNRKRWARRDRAGKVILASGLSLLPLAEKHADLLHLGREHAEKLHTAAILKDRCAITLRHIAELACDKSETTQLIANARNILRRKPDEAVLKALLEELSSKLTRHRSSEHPTGKMRDSDAQIEGHKETDLNQNVEERSSSEKNVDSDEIERAFPKLCLELRFARNNAHCDRIMEDIALYLGLAKDWYQIKSTHGPAISFMLLGYVLQRADRIQNHRAYALSLAKKLKAGEINRLSLLTKHPNSS